jgi:DNA-binding NarL/FixJ family response regulator
MAEDHHCRARDLGGPWPGDHRQVQLVIRIVIVDDHPAVRMGLEAALEDEPGFVCVGSAEDEADLLRLLPSADPDVVLLDQHLPGADGLHICRRIKSTDHAPRVVILSAFAGEELTLAAMLAGADGILDKAVRTQQLRDAVRSTAAGDPPSPDIHPETLRAAAAQLDPEDLPIFGMLLDGTPPEEIAGVLGIDHHTYLQRVDRMIALMAR